MPAAIVIRKDFPSAELRRLARSSKDGQQVRRLLALAALIDGANRTKAAKAGGMERQTLRDWVHRFNADGPAGLINLKAPGGKRKLTKAQRAKVAERVEQGPIPAIDGVVRWRLVDLRHWIYEEYRVELALSTIWRMLKKLGYSHMSGRPKAYGQNDEAIADFKKTSATKSPGSGPRPARRRRSRSGTRTK